MTRKQAFDTVMRELRKNGIVAKRNVKGCCRSCIEMPNDKPTAWHYGGQGQAFTWRDDKPVPTYTPTWQTEEPLEGIWLNHSGLVTESGDRTEAGRLVIDTFQAHGFGVEWGGTIRECIWIAF